MRDLTETQLKELLKFLITREAENEWIEFKENLTEVDKFGETISAVSNSAKYHRQPYGFVVSGVNDISHEITGTTFRPSRDKVKVNQDWEPYMTMQLNPHPNNMTYREFRVDDKMVVIIRVAPNPNPGPLKYGSLAWIRIGSANVPLHKLPDHEKFLWQDTVDETYGESLIMQDLTESEVLKYLYFERFPTITPGQTTISDAISLLLAEDHIIKKQSNGRYAITKLGALLFARDVSSFPALKSKMVRFNKYADNSIVDSMLEKEGQMGYAAGFPKLVSFIMNELPSKGERIVGGLRQDIKLYPEIAIRELLANSLIHQDLMQLGRPTVGVFTDRVEITNPGIPIVNPQMFLTECLARNEKIAALMKRVRICEDRGSGMDKVAFSLEEEQLPAYDITSSDFRTTVTLYAAKPFDEMTKEEKIRACFLHCMRKYARREKTTNASVRERFKIDLRNSPIASRIINNTIEAGLIRVEDPEVSPKFISYVPYWAKKTILEA